MHAGLVYPWTMHRKRKHNGNDETLCIAKAALAEIPITDQLLFAHDPNPISEISQLSELCPFLNSGGGLSSQCCIPV